MIEAGGIGNAHHEGREIMKSTQQTRSGTWA